MSILLFRYRQRAPAELDVWMKKSAPKRVCVIDQRVSIIGAKSLHVPPL